MEKNKLSIFLSYSSKDIAKANKVCDYLEEKGWECWIAPRNVNPGRNYATQIVEAIRKSSLLVLLASKGTNDSEHVGNEVSLAVDNKKPVVTFRLENVVFSDEYIYFLGRKHWIEAYDDFNESLPKLFNTISDILKTHIKPVPYADKVIKAARENIKQEENKDFGEMERQDIADLLLNKSKKCTASIIDKLTGVGKEKFTESINQILNCFMSAYKYNKKKNIENWGEFFANEMTKKNSESYTIKVVGLPGVSKNILPQLVFCKAIEKFVNNKSNFLPCYISLNYFENAKYDPEHIYEQMRAHMENEIKEIRLYLRSNPEIKPIFFIYGIHEHIIGNVNPENLLFDVLKEYGNFRRMLTIDTKLVKNRQRNKMVIPIANERACYTIDTESIGIFENNAEIFVEQVLLINNYNVCAKQVINMFDKLGYQEIDVFLVKMAAEELEETANAQNLCLHEIYEKAALKEFGGDRQKLYKISELIFRYVYDFKSLFEETEFIESTMLLIHKNHTFLDYLIAYYLIKNIRNDIKYENIFKVKQTSAIALHLNSMIKDDFVLQEKLILFMKKNYVEYDIKQRSSCAYWLGKIKGKNFQEEAIRMLKEDMLSLEDLVKNNNKISQDNLGNQYLFRALCYALIDHKQVDVLDEYFCLVVSNDAANVIHRGAVLEYYGEETKCLGSESYYLDTNYKIGEGAIKTLINRLASNTKERNKQYLEIYLITLFLLLQARIQSSLSQPAFDIKNYVRLALEYYEKYKLMPRNTKSERINCYLDSVSNDFSHFLSSDSFDIGQEIYNKYRSIKDIKRHQWTRLNIEDPESVSEHVFSAWLLSMFFLPEDLEISGYNKKEILDMLLIHDMAEGDCIEAQLFNPDGTKDLRKQNLILKGIFLKGTYPNIANLMYYYNLWESYYYSNNINAKIARDINLIQMVYTFCDYYTKYPEKFRKSDCLKWMEKKFQLTTETGYEIFEVLIENNNDFDEIISQSKIMKEKVFYEDKEHNVISQNIIEKSSNIETKLPDSFECDPNAIKVMGYDDLKNEGIDLSIINKGIEKVVKDITTDENSLFAFKSNLELMNSIRENYRVLVKGNNEFIGVWFFVALQPEYYKKALKGELNEKDICLNTIEFIEFPGVYKGYLLLSGTVAEQRSPAAVQALYKSLATHFEYLANMGIFFDEFCAIGLSERGKASLKKLGMKPVCDHAYGGTVYCCDMKNILENSFLNDFPQLINKYTNIKW